ncbi:MAG: N-methylhydantoinase A [Gemmatimonadales bacterium]|nr:MAG: N-methylhydantoinase A [Gemmatimonadales bacterium]
MGLRRRPQRLPQVNRSLKLVGIDTGGTFTDFVVLGPEGLKIHKERSTPRNPAEAILKGLKQLGLASGAVIVHGSTVATNALLERKGARAALLVTQGFEDVLEIGRQARRGIYDLYASKPASVIPADLRFPVKERLGPRGEILLPLNPAEIRRVAERVEQARAESVAICLLHSYANGEHERALQEALGAIDGLFVTASHEVVGEFREYERFSTTAINAYVGPVVSGYLGDLAEKLGRETKVRIMQSNGGSLSIEAARRHAVQTILSGPAGGAVGGFHLGRRAGYDQIVTFDMGGTSTDVCLCPGMLGRTTEGEIGGLPVRLPVIDIHTVGAGGGSIAYRDPGGALRVGPHSAGADPGPACYGLGGTEPTVTDANLLLGRISAAHFLGGAAPLYPDRALEAVTGLAAAIGLSAIEAAEGIVRVANATMERAIRVISLERGYDPRDFVLVCFGGAGAMHAADLARSLGFEKVLVPEGAGTLSALGMLLADVRRDYSQTLLVPTAALKPGTLDEAFRRLEERAVAELEEEGFERHQIALERSLDLRYVGQGFELTVPYRSDFEAAFHRLHRLRYGYADPRRATEVVNARLQAVGRTEKPKFRPKERRGTKLSAAVLDEIPMVFSGRKVRGKLIDRTLLDPGHRFRGPALVVEYSTTTVVPPDFYCSMNQWGDLLLEPS